MAAKDADLQKIEELIAIMKDNDLVEVEIRHGDNLISLKRAQPQESALRVVPVMGGQPGFPASGRTGPEPAVGQAPVPEQKENLVDIKSPIVGTFYATPSPDSDSYVDIGSQVGPQTVVCIIEAMKVMNEIKAETSGTVVEVLVTNGQAVEYGQVLFRVRPD